MDSYLLYQLPTFDKKLKTVSPIMNIQHYIINQFHHSKSRTELFNVLYPTAITLDLIK